MKVATAAPEPPDPEIVIRGMLAEADDLLVEVLPWLADEYLCGKVYAYLRERGRTPT